MDRYLPIRKSRSLVPFFRRDIFRSFFANKDPFVNAIAWSGLAGLLLLVCVDVYLLYRMTNQTQVITHAYLHGTVEELGAEFRLGFYIFLGFAVNDIVKLGAMLSFSLILAYTSSSSCHSGNRRRLNSEEKCLMR